MQSRWDIAWGSPPKPENNPNMRVSDAERNEIGEQLSKHFSDGRLDSAEFQERLDRAMSAKTRADLSGLLVDLPSLRTPEQATTVRAAASPSTAGAQGRAVRHCGVLGPVVRRRCGQGVLALRVDSRAVDLDRPARGVPMDTGPQAPALRLQLSAPGPRPGAPVEGQATRTAVKAAFGGRRCRPAGKARRDGLVTIARRGPEPPTIGRGTDGEGHHA